MVKLGLINYTAGSGRKRYARYDLNWLDGSKEDIKRLKEVLKTKEVESNHIKRSRVKSHQRSRVKSHHKVESNHTTNNKEYNNNELQQQQEETRERKKNKTLDKKKLAATAASSLLNSLKEKTLETLKDYGLSEDTITDLIKNCPAKNKDKYFSQWITHIKTSNIKKPAGFLITMVNKRENPPQKEAKKLSPAARKLAELNRKEADELLKQAKIELGRLCDKQRILSWLEKLPGNYHLKLKKHLDYIYPTKHSYEEAKEEWEKGKWGWGIDEK